MKTMIERKFTAIQEHICIGLGGQFHPFRRLGTISEESVFVEFIETDMLCHSPVTSNSLTDALVNLILARKS